MGSAKLQFQIILLIITFISVSEVSYAMNLTEVYNDKEMIKEWSNENFFGGYEDYSFKKGNKVIFAIIGMPTSGIPTSQILMYQKIDSKFKLIVFRNTIPGIVTAESSDKGVFFKTKDASVLQVSWESIESHTK